MTDPLHRPAAEPPDAHPSGERIPQITIGLFGPRRLVKTMAEVSRQVTERLGSDRVKFLTGGHDDQGEAEDRYLRLKDRIDSAVFPGPWLYDLATAGHWLTVPSTHIPLTGSALYAALLRACLTIGNVDLGRVSIDSLAAYAVEEAYAEIGVDASAVSCRPYDGPESVRGFTAFHQQLWQEGRTTCALTSILAVERELRSLGVPVLRIAPTKATVREAIETAVLLAQGTRLGSHQIAMIAVQLIPAVLSVSESGDYWQQELALSTQQRLLSEARHAGATVSRRSDTLFLVTTTHGGLERLTDQFRTAPFAHSIADQLGVPVAVGAGAGATARSAETNALTAVQDAIGRGGEVAVYLDDSGVRRELSPQALTRPEDGAARDSAPIDARAVEIISRIASFGGITEGRQLVVDVDTVAGAMQVTPRTGRRMLKELLDAGLAWPVPPARSSNGGRPRQQFRLLTEKLE